VVSNAQRLSAGSILVVAMAAFLPWMSEWDGNVYGLDGDGVITLVLAVVGGVVLATSAGYVPPKKNAPAPGRGRDVALLVLAGVVAFNLLGARRPRPTEPSPPSVAEARRPQLETTC